MRKKTCRSIVTRAEQPQQLCLPLESPYTKPEKPQISSIPGISPKERNRYRVVLGGRILGDGLAIDEALKLAGGEG